MEFTSRFTLYDLLAMVFPGCFIIWSVMSLDMISDHVHRLTSMNEIDCYIAFFVAAYILGLGWNTLIGYIWARFIKTIQESLIDKAVRDKGADCIKYFNDLPGETNAKKFNCAFMYVRQNDPRYIIDVVESQISLLRNMAIPFAIWGGLAIYNTETKNTCYCILVAAVVFVVIFSIAILRHCRKYSIVLSNYKNMKSIRKSESNDNRGSNGIHAEIVE